MMGIEVGVKHFKVRGSGHLPTEKGKKMGFYLKASGGNQDC